MRGGGYSDGARAGCVVGLELRLGSRRPGDPVAEHRVDDSVTRLRVAQPPPQRRLFREAELARNRPAALVRRIGPDLDPVGPAKFECHPRQCCGRLRGEALAGAALPDPVADLECVLADARVQARSADDLALVRREDPVDEVPPEIELSPEAPQKLDLFLERLRL